MLLSFALCHFSSFDGITRHLNFSKKKTLIKYLFALIFLVYLCMHYHLVTPEMVAKKIKTMKYNKSPGVDGIPPKLLEWKQ